MIRLVLALALFLLAQPSAAEDPAGQIRALLDAGDIDGLEQTLGALHDAQRKGGSAAALRDINARLFETTHPERGAVILDWQKSHPTSVYAATAAAWRAIKLLEAAGNLDDRYDEPISPAGLAAYLEAREQASSAAERARALADGYPPAYDAWFRLRKVHPDRDDLGRVTAALMSAAPEAQSIRIVLDAMQSWSPHPGRDVLETCLTYAPLAPDYDVDRCVIEAGIRYDAGDDLHEKAAEVLRGIDDPALDGARLQQAVWASSPDGWDIDRIGALYLGLTLAMTDLNWYVNTGRRIASIGKRPEILAKGSDRALDEIAERTADNPLDPSLRVLESALRLERYLRDRDAGDLALARAAWEDGIVLGSTSASYWQAASLLATADKATWDVAEAIVFHENAIAYSGQSLADLVFAFYWLDEARIAAEAAGGPAAAETLDRLQCPMLRMARLADALCKSDPSVAMLCDPAQPPFAHGPAVLAAGAQTCPEVANARLSTLKFEPVPYAKVVLPWKKQ